MEESVQDEILALKSIYEDELKIHEDADYREIALAMTPATAGNEESQYVSLEICIKIPTAYPTTSPSFKVTRSRGISDEYCWGLETKLHALIEERVGECILFDLLELTRDHLTNNNLPSDICSICLCGFKPDSDFLKTSCFHYFHRFCLKDYREHCVKESVDGILSLIEHTSKLTLSKSTVSVPCPVCKTMFDLDVGSIDGAVPPEDEEVVIDYDMIRQQNQQFDKAYRIQLEKGGLIDLEKEKTRYLLTNIPQNYVNHMPAANVDPCNSKDSNLLNNEISENLASTSKTAARESHSRKYQHSRLTSKNNLSHSFWRGTMNRKDFAGDPKSMVPSESSSSSHSNSTRKSYSHRNTQERWTYRKRFSRGHFRGSINQRHSSNDSQSNPTQHSQKYHHESKSLDHGVNSDPCVTRCPTQSRTGRYPRASRRPRSDFRRNGYNKEFHKSKQSCDRPEACKTDVVV